jgi:alcohol dehydrogenase class IV
VASRRFFPTLLAAVDACAGIAEALGEPVAGLARVQPAERAVAAVERLIAARGGPLRLSAFGVREEHLEDLTRDGFSRGNRATSPRTAAGDEVAVIYRGAL